MEGQAERGGQVRQVSQVVRWSGRSGRWLTGVSRETVSVSVPSSFLARPYAKSVPNQVNNR